VDRQRHGAEFPERPPIAEPEDAEQFPGDKERHQQLIHATATIKKQNQ